jgi:hypothetical protein
MSTLPSQHPKLSLHLADQALTPIITSSRSQPQLESLTSLTAAALTAHSAAQRLGLGVPLRMMVEHTGGSSAPLILASFLNPDAGLCSAPIVGLNGSAQTQRTDLPDARPASNTDAEGANVDAAPMLLSLVVAGSSDDALEARRAAARLEKVGGEFQKEWSADLGGEEYGDDGV